MKSMQDTRIYDFVNFIMNPDFTKKSTTKMNTRQFIGWISIILIFDIILGVIGVALVFASGHDIPPDKAIVYVMKNPTIGLFFLLLIAPLIEELTFRAFLSINQPFIFVGLSFFIYFFTDRFYQYQIADQLNNNTNIGFDKYFIGWWLIFPSLFITYIILKKYNSKIINLFELYGSQIFWTSCIVFGIMHSFNYGIGFHLWLIFLIFPQISMGVVLGFLRIRYGLRWSFFAHAAIDWTVIYTTWLTLLLNKLISHRFVVFIVGLVGLGVLGLLFWGFIGLVSRNVGSDNSARSDKTPRSVA